MKEFLIGCLVGFMIGIALCSEVIDDGYCRLTKDSTGFSVTYKDKSYKLVEAEVVGEKDVPE